MLYGRDRDELRRVYCRAWQQHRRGAALDPLQAQIVAVIERHPEYQRLLETPEQALGREYLPELGQTNPFLHMGLHLAIREQVDTDRPAGIRELYRVMSGRCDDLHQLDHDLMDCLAEMLWQAQRDATAPDEQRYLACVRALAART
jgi:hypothetical protein